MPDSLPLRWVPDRQPAPQPWPRPALATALWRGALNRCPACGGSRLFVGWLRVRGACPVCAAPLGQVRADDAPPYFVVFIVGHLAVAGLVLLERMTAVTIAAEAAILVPLTLAAALALLRPVKGATVGLMLRLGITGAPDDA